MVPELQARAVRVSFYSLVSYKWLGLLDGFGTGSAEQGVREDFHP
jgi:hypothetical protein